MVFALCVLPAVSHVCLLYCPRHTAPLDSRLRGNDRGGAGMKDNAYFNEARYSCIVASVGG